MVAVSSPTVALAYEPSLPLPATSSGVDVIFASPAPTSHALLQASTEPGGVQPNTIIGIVVGLVGFVTLILTFSFISKLPCFLRPQPSLDTPPPRQRRHGPYFRPTLDPVCSDMGTAMGYTSFHYNQQSNRASPRSWPPTEHTDARIACASPSTHTAPPSYGKIFYPPSYDECSPPLYPESFQSQRPLQQPNAPQRAVLEA